MPFYYGIIWGERESWVPNQDSGRKSSKLVTKTVVPTRRKKTCRGPEQRISNDRKSFFPSCSSRWGILSRRAASGMGKETAWLENVQRLAGSCLDGRGGCSRGGKRRERAWARERAEGHRRGKERRRRRDSPEGVSLYPRDLKPNRWRIP